MDIVKRYSRGSEGGLDILILCDRPGCTTEEVHEGVTYRYRSEVFYQERVPSGYYDEYGEVLYDSRDVCKNCWEAA